MNDPDPRHTSDGFDNDAIFADIVAHLNDDAAEPVGPAVPWVEDAAADIGSAENQAEAHASTDQPTAEDRPLVDQPPGPPAPAQPQALPTPQAWRAQEVDDEYEEHFQPLPVAPLPVGDLQFWAIIVGMGGGPLLLLYLVLFNREAGGSWILTAIAMSVGGFVLLVSRLPGHQGDDDDGARL
jgi:hypothetical protein